ncbi:MAG: ribulose-phosphate 3-epimerase [Acidimicrobiia bacterium]
MRNPVRMAPSILAADFANLASEVARVEPFADLLHVDVMDGHFVPNISLGPPVVSSLRAATTLHLDCHLMITDPLTYLPAMHEAGADGVTVHIEAVPNPNEAARVAADLDVEFGLVLNPPTPVESVEPFLELCSMVVVMSVHPGFGGQAFIEAVVPKIVRLREIIDAAALSVDIQVDGGIDQRTAALASKAGADVFVAGTSVFGASDPAAAIDSIRVAAQSEMR